MISQNAIAYAVRHLYDVAFPRRDNPSFEVLTQECHVLLHIDNLKVIVPLFNDFQWNSFLSGNAETTLIDSFDKSCRIPICFASNADNFCSFDADNSTIYLNADVISPTFALLSRFEERNPDAIFDKHGRFLFEHSILNKYGIVEIPLVDEYAMLLRKAVAERSPETVDSNLEKAKIILTHDIDILSRFHNTLQAMRSIFGRDLLINRSLADMTKSLYDFCEWRKNRLSDPYVASIFDFQNLANDIRCEQIFFFKAQIDGEIDATYNVFGNLTKEIVQKLYNNGGKIGLHGSYNSATNFKKLSEEKLRLESVVGDTIVFARQHFLRTQFSNQLNSAALWESAAIGHDFSLGFAEHCGFKCGTCHPFHLYNIDEDRPSPVVEHPLIVMDGTLFDYMKLSIEESNSLIQKILHRIKSVGGEFVILWHNHTTTRNYKDFYNNVFLNNFSTDNI